MVSGLRISPKERSNISSGDNSPTVIELNERDSLDVGLFVNNNLFLLKLVQ